MKTQAERNRASRIRAKAKKGKAGIDDLSWLQEYERTSRKSSRTTRAPKAQPPPQAAATPDVDVPNLPPAAPPESAKPGSAPFSSAPAGEARARVQTGFTSISFAGGPAGPGPASSAPTGVVPLGATPPGPTCSIPDCPACKQQTGLICETTGKRVYPPMSVESATGLAEGILFIVGLIARVMRKDKHQVTPTEHEIKCLAMGIREVQMRRANWLSAGSDFVMVWMGLGSYGKRAFTEKPKKGEKKND